MDKMKGIAKGGWHPSNDRRIHRDTWKSDLKGVATGKKKDPYEEQRNHESRPLASLRDPESFGPPPKHSAYYDSSGVSRTGTGLSGGGVSRAGTASSAGSGPSGGWGAPAVESGYARQKREREEQERQRMEQQVQEEKAGPYRTDTSGLRTDHLPKPPVTRRIDTESPGAASPVRTSSPALPPRVPPRQAVAAPPPSLPPRQNEYPDEYTPAPPPPYNEALRQPQVQQNQDPAAINQGASNRLGQAGVSVPGFGIGGASNASSSQPESPATRGPPAGQLSELQQRFASMNTGASNEASSPASPVSPANGLAAAAHKKAPPPPPPKKAALHAPAQQSPGASGFNNEQPPAPPPLPMSSKPRPS